MPQYLITISIGPVQDFIAAARKTRDLWMGSYLLSEISKATALNLHKQKAELIFPSLEGMGNPDQALQPCENPEGCFNVGNKLLAIIETDNPEGITQKAEAAAQARWLEIANNAAKKIPVKKDFWDKQINDILEFYASWVLYEPEKEASSEVYYKEQRERLDQLLNARKNTREFKQNLISGDGIPKSSLDGLRENVIEHKNIKSKWDLRRLGLNEKEYLDVTGVAKRLGEKPEQFTPLSRLALDPWIRGLPSDVSFDAIKEILKQLATFGLCSSVKGNQGIYERLPYDGQLLYKNRIEAEKTKLSSDKPDDNKVTELLDTLTKQINDQKLYKNHGEPQPYMAILAADGDRMGELLDKMQTRKDHKEISKTLTEFAIGVPDIVRDYLGHCIYAGGDDVLALLPLHTAIQCSKALADYFKQTMERVNGVKERSDIEPPTLSCGLGISHFLTPMTKQLDLARKAEKLAKSNELPEGKSKNALAIILQPRSGAAISFRERWDYKLEYTLGDNSKIITGAEGILNNWITAHLDTDGIPRQAGYNLRDEAVDLDWCEATNESHQKLIQLETMRILGKKRSHDDKGNEKSLKSKWITIISERAKQQGLAKTADELIMTYRIAQAYSLAGEKPETIEEKEESHVQL